MTEVGEVPGGSPAPLLLYHLSENVLEEIFGRCDLRGLINVLFTCKYFKQIVSNSERVWLLHLDRTWGFRAKMRPSEKVRPGILQLCGKWGENGGGFVLPFRGALVTGGVEADSPQYWVHNLFAMGTAPFCSKSGANVNCMGLYLEGSKPDDLRYRLTRRYMIDRCCYAAAIFFFSQNGGVRRDPLTMRRLMVRWSEVELEEFFRDLMASLQRNEPLGGLLLHNTRQGPAQHAGARPPEEERLLDTLRYLDERVRLRMQALKPLDAARDVVCDASPYEVLRDGDCKESVGFLRRILLSRRGALTCPVRTGVVFVALCDPEWLRYMGSQATGRKLLEAARSAVSARFEGLTAAEVVERSETLRTLPRILVTDECYAGLTHEFDLRDEEWGGEEIWAGRRDPPEFAEFLRPNLDSAEDERCRDEVEEKKVWLFANYVIRLRPLLWFQFHSRDEASRFMGGVEHRQQCLRYRGPAKRRGYLGTQNQTAIPAPPGMVPAAEGGSHADRSQARGAASSGASRAAGGSASGVQARRGEEEAGAAGVALPRALRGSAEVCDAEVDLRETASMASSGRSESLGDARSDEGGLASSRELNPSTGSGGPNMNAEREALSSGGEGDSESLGSHSEDLYFDDDEDFDDEDFEDEDSEDEDSENEDSDEDFQDFVERFEDDVEIDYEVDALSQTSGSSHSFDDEDVVMDRMDGVLDLEGHSLSKTHRRNRLYMELHQPVAANLAMVKLIDQEDLMEHFNDQGPPNIDMTCVRFEGGLHHFDSHLAPY